METELADLSINEEDDEILQIPLDHGSGNVREEFQLVGCFLTASIIHFPTMKSKMANLWHPVRGVQIRDLGEKRYLFQFFHIMDMERVLKDSPWTFNNHLFLINKLQWGKDPFKEASRPVTMKILSWNVRGLGRPRTIRRLRHTLKVHNPQIVFFMETKLEKRKMEQVRRKCGFVYGLEVDSEGSRGGLCMAWRMDVSIQLRSFSKRHIDVEIEDADIRRKWRFTGFYGSPYAHDRNDSWEVLKCLGFDNGIQWLVCGDFNEIMYGSEKKGGLPRGERRMDLFRKTLEECELIDVEYSGRWFTWERGNLPETNIRERLDRGVANNSWISMFPRVKVQHLVHSFSNHCPILINTCREEERLKSKLFRFEAWWPMEESFFNEVKQIWEFSSGDLLQNLEAVKRGLEKWASQIQWHRKRKQQKLFSTGQMSDSTHLLSGIARCIQDEDNNKLTMNYTKEEIEAAVFEMGPTKAPGEDGLPGLFYQKCWPIVGNDVVGFCLHLLNGDMESAFVPERLISDNVLLAYEILNTLKQKRVGKKGLMVVKLDMSKAYDQLGVKFQPSRGLRQGDPLSPFLFLICGEGLSSLMRLAAREGLLKGVKASRNGPPISHLLFADDCILFGEATRKGAQNTREEDRQMVVNLLGVRSSSEPEHYLGLPNIVARKKKEAFQNLKDRLKKRIDNWSTRFLSQGGKEFFIKAILQAIPTYTMACFLLPSSLCKDIESIIAKYWWQKGHGKRGIHWCSWKNLCCLKESGGLARVLNAKYYPNSNFLEAQLGRLPSLTWKSIWADKGLLQKGLCWRIGRGNKGVDSLERPHSPDNLQPELVSDLIDGVNRKWKVELINHTFHLETARKILQISLSESAHEDFQIWKGEQTGEYSVVHERVYSTGADLTQKVQNLVAEYEGVRANKRLLNMVCNQRVEENLPIIKIQFDAAFDSSNYRSATGLVVWGKRNEYLASKSFIHYDIASPFAAEAYAGLEAVKLGIEMGIQEIQIQGDSLTVIKKCQLTTIDYSVIGAIIRNIQAKKVGFQKIEFKHIPKMKNMSAHNIAKKTLKRSERTHLETHLEDGELNCQHGREELSSEAGSDGIGDLKRREDNCFQPLKV
ncbi:hypothetical protein CXB51_027072 [Gossypium anomalum]|uniref:Reverse transcriptase n=1 Tax=Gossypium anomalum TaxID=47600 RepID=A0A8J5Z5W8_9ROSI|nr:hypothetical protein CXB51_027072 [Gossypium anomalum]